MSTKHNWHKLPDPLHIYLSELDIGSDEGLGLSVEDVWRCQNCGLHIIAPDMMSDLNRMYRTKNQKYIVVSAELLDKDMVESIGNGYDNGLCEMQEVRMIMCR